ncbi:SDR family NAD(P)-dependent oxidoreductase [Planctomycetota bacterium]
MTDLVDIVGPALRGLFAENGKLPLVSFVDSKEDGGPKHELAQDLDVREVVETVKQVVAEAKGNAGALKLDGIGSFMVHPIDSALTGRAAGKVAMVTGAAQGFGLEIAQDLAAEGAYVILADLNEAGAQAAAADLNNQYGEGRALGLAINVTDGDSIAAALSQVVRTYGGVDVFIANAGVLKAESVKTQSTKDFDFVQAVNYKGYFLCVQKVAPILAAQFLACPDTLGDIIQINSKSGLQGSNRNGAYAGSKFGGVGLTQSFAMELIEDGIKVNSICPGNFFDGPLWSNPENGLFVQYLRTNKVPGAKTIDEVRKFYEAKVPMGRGCTTSDVMKAVYYLMEQQYETGQAVPVTGGQIMLH